jgi:hypothetical protein
MQCIQPEGHSILLQGRRAQQSPKASMLASETKVVELILLTANGAPLETEVVRQQAAVGSEITC